MNLTLSAFRLGDIRGIFRTEIDDAFALALGHAVVHQFDLTGAVAVGRDMRDSSPGLQQSLIKGLLESGVDVIDLGLCATELGYFASTLSGINAAIVITASHNPAEFNGFKLVLKDGKSVTFEEGLEQVMTLMLAGYTNQGPFGTIIERDVHQDYLAYLAQQFQSGVSARGVIALNGLNGTAATLAQDIAQKFDLPVEWLRYAPGPIPQEGTDPSRVANIIEMNQFMQTRDFAFGVAWDGDCDRCVFFDEKGKLAPAYYIVGILAEHYLQAYPGAAIVYDSKLCLHTLDIAQRLQGRAIRSETGHAFMKRNMRKNKAIYGGELSSHHYFGEFGGCDSGMYAWLKMLQILDQTDQTLEELIEQSRARVCSTQEINLTLTDMRGAFDHLLACYGQQALRVDFFDGLSFDMPGDWRFTLRPSKTESLVRLNLEGRGHADQLINEGAELLMALNKFQSQGAHWTDLPVIQ